MKQQEEAMATAIQTQSATALEGFASDTQQAAQVARQYPRSITDSEARIRELALLSPATAAECFYSLRKGGEVIQGPSVRLAEIAAASWGNVRAGAVITGETPDGRFVEAQGLCIDLETNTVITMAARRSITGRKGKYSPDMIAVTANAAAAIAFRNAVFKVVPRAIIEPIYEAARELVAGEAARGSLRDKASKMLARFSQINPALTAEVFLQGRTLDDVTPEDLVHWTGLGTGLKNGDITVDDVLDQLGGSEVPTSASEVIS